MSVPSHSGLYSIFQLWQESIHIRHKNVTNTLPANFVPRSQMQQVNRSIAELLMKIKVTINHDDWHIREKHTCITDSKWPFSSKCNSIWLNCTICSSNSNTCNVWKKYTVLLIKAKHGTNCTHSLACLWQCSLSVHAICTMQHCSCAVLKHTCTSVLLLWNHCYIYSHIMPIMGGHSPGKEIPHWR